MKVDDAVDSTQVGFCTATLIDCDYIRGFCSLLKPFSSRKAPAKGLCCEVFQPNLAQSPESCCAKRYTIVELLVRSDSNVSREISVPRTGSPRRPIIIPFTPDDKISSGCDSAIARKSTLNTKDVKLEAGKLSTTEREAIYQKKSSTLEDFWRAMGFRCIGPSIFFCFAGDADHASHSILPQDDYLRPSPLKHTPRVDGQDFPLVDPVAGPNDWEPKEHDDVETKKLLEACLLSYPATDPT